MSTNFNTRESESFQKLMNHSMHSNHTQDNSQSNSKKIRIRSNTLFAYQDDHIYSKLYLDEFEDHQTNSLNFNLPTNNMTLSNDPYYIPNNNLNNSNFFSICDKSQWLNNTTTEKNHEHEDLESSIYSITEDMERQLGFLNEVDDDLNDAKLSLKEESSIISEKSSANQNGCYIMNMTTPVNQKVRRQIESEDFKNMNTNLNTQQSFSSFLTNWNCATSNGSSFQILEDKQSKITNNFENAINQKIVSVNTNQNLPKNLQHSKTLNTGKVLGNPILTDSNISNSGNNQINDLHARSVDFTNKSPLKVNLNCGFPNYLSHNQYVNIGDYDQTITNNSNHNIMYNANYKTQNNMTPYSVCQDNNVYYKGYFESYNSLNNINKNIICPIKFNPNDDKNILDNLLVLIKDQNGCRLIQKKLEEKKEDFYFKFYEKINTCTIDIINDQFGNYVIQKFIECCADASIVSKLLEKIKTKLNQISTNPYGTRVFQKMLEYITHDSDYEIIKDYLTNNVFSLVKDANGNHVIQKILQIYPNQKNTFILKEIEENIVEISKLKQGSCIFQKVLEFSKAVDKKTIIEKIMKNLDSLINDEFGNFIIQHILNLAQSEYNEKIYIYVKDNFIRLSKQKYSSNVIDKCILQEDLNLSFSLIDKMIELRCIGELIVDQYGNYVVQKALKVSHGIRFIEIIEIIKKSMNLLKQSSNGRKIHEKLMRNYGDYFVSRPVSIKVPVIKKQINQNKK